MLIILFCCVSFIFLNPLHAQDQEIAGSDHFSFTVNNHDQQFSKIGCLLLCIGNDELLHNMGKLIKFDLEFTDQLDVCIKKAESIPTGDVLEKLFDKGTSLCIFLHADERKKDILPMKVTIVDPSSGESIFSRTFDCSIKNSVHECHTISHHVYPLLVGQEVPVLSTLAYCKQISPHNKAICIADYACRKERLLFQSNTINLAPRWHSKAPVIFYSQLATSKTKLMSYNIFTGKRSVVCAYDGLNMQPSFSRDGTCAVLCMSAGKNGNSELFWFDQKTMRNKGRRIFTQLTNNGGNNVSPCLLANDDIVFCSDFEKGHPQIYYLDRAKKRVHRLTNGKGYCTAPSYCSVNNSIVYNRLVKGTFQLCLLSLDEKKLVERRLTKGPGNKQEPTWSGCGKYIAFSYDGFGKEHNACAVSQIAVLNMASKKIKIVTSGNEAKSFPCWINQTYYV